MVAKKSNSNELKITRIYDAPVKAVWDAWVDPKQAAKWWGPRGFTITTHSKDLRVGGHWAYTMHGPDGVDYENKTIYHEVVDQKRMVYDHGGNDDRPPLFRVTVTFEPVKGGKTKMDMTMTLPTPEAAAQTKKFVKQAGGNGTWDRLAEYLEEQSSGKQKFVINRTFEAPIQTVFDMWTKPEHFKQWMGPTGSTMDIVKADIKVGSSLMYSMGHPQGMMLHGRINYQEISAPNRLVYTQQFTDDKFNPTRAPFDGNWPMTMLTTVELAEEDSGETRITLTWEVDGDYTAEELATFVKEKGGMTQGWTGSFDKLEEYIASHTH
ncbi:SRPBCC domain-containing protein [Bdellovibrio sp. HCB209]|uniref:SRPBCC domain-containing protein n=1 Tax=Bdellovibrio sp. HCB209 TaxID=3394354 RepID=UPI0039B55511